MTKNKTTFMSSLMLFILPITIHANENIVAKVILIKGEVKAKLVTGEVVAIKNDQSVAEETTLETGDKSFIKLMFIDKSQINIGPNSQMLINAFPKDNAGIITLIKGQIRSKITKDYMNINEKEKSKIFIKTNSAALGIRGTDFQVNFNPNNLNTSLITFEGKVAMAHLEKGERLDSYDQSKLEHIVSSEKAVMVERGQISTVNLNIASRAMQPTLLAPVQMRALQKNETGTMENNDHDTKQYRSPIPHGAESSLFSNITTTTPVKTAEANGFFHANNGEYKLPAGSIIDLKTVNIIPPPSNAVFDQNSKAYIVPENYGKINKETGEYKAPEGLKLENNGKFILIDQSAFGKTPNSKNEVPKIYDAQPSISSFIEKTNIGNTSAPVIINETQLAIADERINKTTTARETASNLGTAATSRTVKFILNAQ